jgi:hypothetical protein
MKFHLTILRHPWSRSCTATLISLMPIWLRPKDDHPFARALVPVLITYCLAAVGTTYIDPPVIAQSNEPGVEGPVIRLVLVLLVTIIYAVAPVFGFGYLVYRSRNSQPGGCSQFLLMGVWFGWPILGLASHTGWLTLAAAVLHVALARREQRTWVFVEYGSTSLALLMFLVFFGNQLFPWGLLVVLLQAPMLTLSAVWGRKLYFAEVGSASGEAAKREDLVETSLANCSLPQQGKRRKAYECNDS